MEKNNFLQKSINGFDLTKKISKSLKKDALIMEVNGILKDLSYEITKDCTVKIITSKDKEGLDVLRHDAAHIQWLWRSKSFIQELKLQLVQLLKTL